MLLVPLLFAPYGCGSERGPRDAGDTVSYAGYIYAGPDTSSGNMATGGLTTFEVDGVGLPATEVAPDSYPGYWSIELPAKARYDLTITSEGAWTARWAGTAPATAGAWYSGALFGGAPAEVMTFLTALGVSGTGSLSPDDDTVVHVLGSAWDGENWDCAEVLVGGETPDCFAQDPETGVISRVRQGPFDYFVQLGLPAGPVTVDSGLGGTYTYPASGGDLVYAFWFQGAPS